MFVRSSAITLPSGSIPPCYTETIDFTSLETAQKPGILPTAVSCHRRIWTAAANVTGADHQLRRRFSGRVFIAERHLSHESAVATSFCRRTPHSFHLQCDGSK
jgi:hypothetical protein